MRIEFNIIQYEYNLLILSGVEYLNNIQSIPGENLIYSLVAWVWSLSDYNKKLFRYIDFVVKDFVIQHTPAVSLGKAIYLHGREK